MADLTVHGEIALPAEELPERAGEVTIQVEDVSLADAPSVVVGEQRLRDVPLAAGGSIPFEVTIPEDRIDPRAIYSVRAHVDVPGTGGVKVGDLLTVQSFPVLTRGHGDEVPVRVRRI